MFKRLWSFKNRNNKFINEIFFAECLVTEDKISCCFVIKYIGNKKSTKEILEWDCFKINTLVKFRQDESVQKDSRLMRYEAWVT